MQFPKYLIMLIIVAGISLLAWESPDSSNESRSLGKIPFSASHERKEVCVDGALYLAERFTPSSAVVTAEGKGVSCHGEVQTLDDFGHSYREVCRQGVLYIRYPNIKNPAFFAEIDPDTLYPERCGDHASEDLR